MLYVDIRYIRLLSSTLRNFKQQDTYKFNCSCPICGDSKKDLTKARGYFIKREQFMYFYCHNCSASLSMPNLLKLLNPIMFKDYLMDNLQKPAKTKAEKAYEKTEEAYKKLKSRNFLHPSMAGATKINQLPEDSIAKKYLLSRQIPLKHHGCLYYTSDFKGFVANFDEILASKLRQGEKKLLIPFFDKTGREIPIIQARQLEDNGGLRYITLKIDEEYPKIYGMERWRRNLPTFITEGPLDSLFVDNCLAVAGGDLTSTVKFINPIVERTTFLFDNEPRSRDTIKRMEKAIALGYYVCIWKKNIVGKDINEIILKKELTNDQLLDTIRTRRSKGLEAKLRLNDWKRI